MAGAKPPRWQHFIADNLSSYGPARRNGKRLLHSVIRLFLLAECPYSKRALFLFVVLLTELYWAKWVTVLGRQSCFGTRPTRLGVEQQTVAVEHHSVNQGGERFYVHESELCRRLARGRSEFLARLRSAPADSSAVTSGCGTSVVERFCGTNSVAT